MQIFLGWSLFTAGALVGQNCLHGIDLLGPGLALCLRQGWRRNAIWPALVWMVIQEGVGNLPFGSALLLYSGVPVLFFGLKWGLDPAAWIFTVLLAFSATVWEGSVLHLFLSLQSLPTTLAGGWERFLLQFFAYVLIMTVGSLIVKKVS